MTGLRSASRSLLRNAELARLLSRGFSYPDSTLIAEVGAIEDAAGLPGLAGYGLLQLQTEYTLLFARKVPCPLNASAYGAPGMGAVQDLARVAAFYGAFGFQVAPAARELPDHLCIQLEFVGVLCAKQAFAADQGWDDRVKMCADARSKFASEHLAPWVPRLRERLEKHARIPFYPRLCGSVQDLVEGEADAAAASAG